jgi:hypothetical protein
VKIIFRKGWVFSTIKVLASFTMQAERFEGNKASNIHPRSDDVGHTCPSKLLSSGI